MIKIRNLWKRYGTNDVLKGLNLDVRAGGNPRHLRPFGRGQKRSAATYHRD